MKRHVGSSKLLRVVADKRTLCDQNCNHCPLLRHRNSRMLTAVMNVAHATFGAEFYRLVQSLCPNFTCCHDCHVDDFVHVEGCVLAPMEEHIAHGPGKAMDHEEEPNICDPWDASQVHPDCRVMDVTGRMDMVKRESDLGKLFAMEAWGETQETVRAAARRKWERLLKRAMRKTGGAAC